MFRLHDGTLVLSASDITAHLACPHLEQQRLAVARGERRRPHAAVDAHAELIRRRGDAHEAEQLARLSAEAGGDVADLAEDFDVRDRRRAGARGGADGGGDARRRGADLPADVLRRALDGSRRLPAPRRRRATRCWTPSSRGRSSRRWSISSRSTRGSPGAAPARARDPRRRRVETIDLGASPRCTGASSRASRRWRRAGAWRPSRRRSRTARSATSRGECRGRRVAVDHLSLVAGARRDQRDKLVALGIATVAALAAGPRTAAGRARAERFDCCTTRRRCRSRSRETRRAAPPAPARPSAPAATRGCRAPSPGDVFFDLEGDPFALPDRGLEYLWGWWTPTAATTCLWAHDEAARARGAASASCDFVHERLARAPGHARLPLRAARDLDAAHARDALRDVRGGGRRAAAPRGARRPLRASCARACRSARRATRSRSSSATTASSACEQRDPRGRRLDRRLRAVARDRRRRAAGGDPRLQRGGLPLHARAARLAAG